MLAHLHLQRRDRHADLLQDAPGRAAGHGLGPAASLVGLALRSGARVALVNRGETPYDEAVTLRVWAGIADVLPPAVERVKRALEKHRD